MTGQFRVIPGKPKRGQRPYWMVGRDEAGGIQYVLTTYSRTPRRWLSEESARTECAITQALYDEHARAQERAAQLAAARAHLPPSWPFPVSAHDWKWQP